MRNDIGWTDEDRQRRNERVRLSAKLGLSNTIDEKAARRADLLRDILEWDAARKYIMPYRLRDPIRKELGL